MASEQQRPQQNQPQAEVKTTLTADEKRKADSAKVLCTVISGKIIAGDPEDGNKQRIYEEGETIALPQKQADELRASGYIVFQR